jgi:replicative DNA helicase
MESLGILDPTSKSKKKPEAIPDLLRQALSISFEKEFGHDYLRDAEARYDEYQDVKSMIPFSLSMLNQITEGGMPIGSLFLCSAATGQGKSLFLTDQAAFWLSKGYNVLYVSLEMSEFKTAERIDAKLFQVDINKLKKLPKEVYMEKIEQLRKKSHGKLKFKQYSAGTFHANHLRALLEELKQRESFVPDCVIVDYLGIMASYRVKADMGSYTLMKFIAEELRSVAVDFKCRIYSATQVNRGGVNNSDPDLTNMADSMGIAHTADVIVIMAGTPELEAVNLVRFIQAKNRYGSMTPGSFTVGIDRPKMTLYDADTPSNQAAATAVAKTPIKIPGGPQLGGTKLSFNN